MDNGRITGELLQGGGILKAAANALAVWLRFRRPKTDSEVDFS